MKTWIQRLYTNPVYKKYSQCGEEGYLAWILNRISPEKKRTLFIVDLGAGDGEYLSNTRSFLEAPNPRFESVDAILIDGHPGEKGHSNNVKMEWLTKENVVAILKKYNCPVIFDLLSIDLDGNDFWLLTEILMNFRPSLVVCEINGCIAAGESKAIVYNPSHTWNNDDYYGMSLDAVKKLASRMGYTVVFQNDSLNAYLVRTDMLTEDEIASVNLNYVQNQYHSHNKTGAWVNI